MTLDRWQIPTCDEELVEVFLDEVSEILQDIDTSLKSWSNDPKDKKALTDIRRSFHTLKGSGRMVKAIDLSEVAWKAERMLNQALAGTVPVSEPMVKLVAALRAQIPSLVNAFKHGHPVAGSREIEHLMRLADTLARGETPSAPPRRATTAATVEQPLAPHEVSARLERCMQRADEALHRSEMALQQARRLSALIEDPQRERPRSGVGRDIEETRQTDTTRHRVAWLRLVLSALVGGLIATALLLSLPYLG